MWGNGEGIPVLNGTGTVAEFSDLKCHEFTRLDETETGQRAVAQLTTVRLWGPSAPHMVLVWYCQVRLLSIDVISQSYCASVRLIPVCATRTVKLRAQCPVVSTT